VSVRIQFNFDHVVNVGREEMRQKSGNVDVFNIFIDLASPETLLYVDVDQNYVWKMNGGRILLCKHLKPGLFVLLGLFYFGHFETYNINFFYEKTLLKVIVSIFYLNRLS
jgi:hypothetical protein